MNENERTAVNQLKNIREVSAVKLKKIDKGSPDAKPLVYISNIKRADILLRMINEQSERLKRVSYPCRSPRT